MTPNIKEISFLSTYLETVFIIISLVYTQLN